jgi:hypothetical protein
MQRSIWSYKKKVDAQEAADIHGTVALADVGVEGVDEPPKAFVLGTPRGSEGNSSGSGFEPSPLERADPLVEEEFGDFRFDGQDNVLKLRCRASNSHITAAIEDGEMVSGDES